MLFFKQFLIVQTEAQKRLKCEINDIRKIYNNKLAVDYE